MISDREPFSKLFFFINESCLFNFCIEMLDNNKPLSRSRARFICSYYTHVWHVMRKIFAFSVLEIISHGLIKTIHILRKKFFPAVYKNQTNLKLHWNSNVVRLYWIHTSLNASNFGKIIINKQFMSIVVVKLVKLGFGKNLHT